MIKSKKNNFFCLGKVLFEYIHIKAHRAIFYKKKFEKAGKHIDIAINYHYNYFNLLLSRESNLYFIKKEKIHENQSKRFHPYRIAGRDSHYCHPRRNIVPGFRTGAGESATIYLHQQSKADCGKYADVRTRP
jgi:hypothetical protein